MTNQYAIVTTTTDSEDKARALAAGVVDGGLAACAQLYPIASVYRWEGKVESGREWRLDFKTRTALVDELTAFVVARHDYDTPEVVVVPVTGGHTAYLDWVAEETRA
ncbi:divalent-cation tolerance protein CutA [Streptomyces sp. SCA3-4]|uniref:divalent-cation tolerance protein CutA n=1 Tax=Streptomyces sichuanensis TaxID=2871810 RepID=UPI001CE29332|nr:divalent-cation tolerance protein CutA [Streptomyces sichuanensis]MCA6093815.1 divalent-cation tolerance protein CutA [Streptomyces sichuanensis]